MNFSIPLPKQLDPAFAQSVEEVIRRSFGERGGGVVVKLKNYYIDDSYRSMEFTLSIGGRAELHVLTERSTGSPFIKSKKEHTSFCCPLFDLYGEESISEDTFAKEINDISDQECRGYFPRDWKMQTIAEVF